MRRKPTGGSLTTQTRACPGRRGASSHGLRGSICCSAALQPSARRSPTRVTVQPPEGRPCCCCLRDPCCLSLTAGQSPRYRRSCRPMPAARIIALPPGASAPAAAMVRPPRALGRPLAARTAPVAARTRKPSGWRWFGAGARQPSRPCGRMLLPRQPRPRARRPPLPPRWSPAWCPPSSREDARSGPLQRRRRWLEAAASFASGCRHHSIPPPRALPPAALLACGWFSTRRCPRP